MRDRNDTILVFTSETLGTLLAEGGSQAWKLNAARAQRCSWIVCVRNRLKFDRPRPSGSEAHGAGFLLGRISAVTEPTQPGHEERWKIAFDAFAPLDMPRLWGGWQNPVHYGALGDLGIDPAHLAFRPVRLWGGWTGMPGPTGYRQIRHEPPATAAGVAAVIRR
jgi:hypothetical protein